MNRSSFLIGSNSASPSLRILRSFAAIYLLFAKRSCSGEAGSSEALLIKKSVS